MFVGGGPGGDCPSLDRRRERRGAAAFAGSVGFVPAFSGHGSGAADESRVCASGSCCGSAAWTSSLDPGLDCGLDAGGSEGR